MSDAKPDNDKPNSTLPAVLVAVAILAVAAVLIFWPSDDAVEGEVGGPLGGDALGDGDGDGPGIEDGAVPARDHDPAYRRSRASDAVRNSPRAMLEKPRPQEIPEFQSKAEEVAWYEEQRRKAKTILDMRQRAVDRLGSTPPSELPDHERSRRAVEENLEQAQKRLTEIDNHLAELGQH